ncbi:O-antigen ligase [Clostridium sp. YIM B02551]|uniref:O-antigen ligase family protein n=1 Tax=Clostridium sp. YIM B02551 TaxID=2910679 RepID=UPI001EEC4FD7|nr:hypothetical protein [Clostridium sp. YIM B02551]
MKNFHPDLMTGTFSNANQLSIFLIIALFLVVLNREKEIKMRILYGIILSLMISITDAKHVWVAFILGGIVLIAVYQIKNRKYNIMKNVAMFLMAIITITSLTMYLNKNNGLLYIKDSSVNLKYQAYLYTFKNFEIPQSIIGRGPGTYGSKAANALAYDYMYKTDESITLPKIIPSRVNEDYKFIASLFTKEYMDSIQYYSAILSYPISNYITIYGELGILGLLIFILFACISLKNAVDGIKNKRNLRTNIIGFILIIFTLIVMFIDNYLEMNEFSVLLMMFIAFVNSQNEKMKGLRD